MDEEQLGAVRSEATRRLHELANASALPQSDVDALGEAWSQLDDLLDALPHGPAIAAASEALHTIEAAHSAQTKGLATGVVERLRDELARITVCSASLAGNPTVGRKKHDPTSPGAS